MISGLGISGCSSTIYLTGSPCSYAFRRGHFYHVMAPNRPSRGRTGACGPTEMNQNNPLLVSIPSLFRMFRHEHFSVIFRLFRSGFFLPNYLNSARFNSTFLLSKKTSPDRWFWLLGTRERPADKQTATLETPEIKAISRKNVDFLEPPKSEPVKGKLPKCANAFFY